MNQTIKVLRVHANSKHSDKSVRLLQSAGHEVVEADSGEACLQLIPNFRPQLVLLDAELSDGDSLEVCRQIKQLSDSALVSVVLLYPDQANPEILMQGFAAGADDVLPHSAPEPVLLAKIQKQTQLQKLHDSFKVQQQWLHAAMSLTSDAVIFMDERGEVSSLNSTAEFLTGWRQPQVVGQPIQHILNLLDDKTVSSVNHLLETLLESGELPSGSTNAMLIHKNGHRIPIVLKAAVIKNDRGESTGIVLNLRDLREHKRAEDKVKASEELYSHIVESMSDGILVLDREFHYLYWNRAMEKIFNVAREQLVGTAKLPWELFPHLKREGVDKLMRQAMQGKPTKKENIPYTLPDGRSGYTDEIYIPLKDATGDIRGILGVIRDTTEQNRAQKIIQQQNQFLLSTIDSLTHPFYVIDVRNYQIVLANAAAQLEKANGKSTCYALTHKRNVPCNYAGELCPLEIIKRTHKPVKVEHVHYDKHSLKRFFEVHGYPIFDEKMNLMQIIEYNLDVTERKQAETKLRESEERFRRFFEEDLSGDFITTPQGKLLACNAAYAHMLGFNSVEEALQTDVYEVYTSRKERNDYLRLLKKKKKLINYERELVRKDGTKIWVVANVNGQFDTHGELIEIRGYIFDITERRRAEKALKESERRFRDLFENSPDAIFVQDLAGNVLDVNPAGCALHGYTREELIGKNAAELVPPNVRGAAKYNLQSAFASKPGYLEGASLTIDGKVIPSEIRASKINYGGRSAHLLIVRDISERKRLEDQLQQAQKMETIGTLAGGIAHDFNNLLTVILGNAEFALQDVRPGEPIYDDLTKIEKAAEQAGALVSQLLTFSRQSVLDLKFLNLNDIVEETLKMLKRVISENIELSTKLAENLHLVKADPSQMQQVLMNLSVNARDAMPQGGKLTIATRNIKFDEVLPMIESQFESLQEFNTPNQQFVELVVEDSGSGMDEKIQGRIFEPFFTTKKVGKGTGLGLSVVYGIVKQHKGMLHVSSQPNKGTTFKIYLPAISKADLNKRARKKTAAIPRGSETILVVEDDRSVKNVCVRILNKLGYQVLTAENGLQAIKIFQSNHEKIDLVLMDVVMPELSGPDTYLRLQTIKPDLPVIFVTGYDVHDEMDEASRIDMKNAAVLQKPYTKRVLANRIRKLLESSKQI